MCPPGGSPTSYDEHPESPGNFPESRRCTSNIDSLITHYSSFGEAIRANSAIGLVESEKAGDRAAEYHPTTHIPRYEEIPEQIGFETVPAGETAATPASRQDTIGPGAFIAIIPAYNEELSIGSVVLQTKHFVNYVIVVDDGSTDNTSFIAEAAGAEVIRISQNSGKAAAMMKGFERARELNPAIVVMLDGDGQHNPAEIPHLIKPVFAGKADMVIGSRFLIQGNNIPRYRKLGQKTLDVATQMSSGYPSTDSQSGFRAISRKGLRCLDFISEGYNIESDMITHFLQKGLVISEVPITVKYDVQNGHKKNALSHGYEVLSHLVGLLGYRRPLITFGVPGAVLTMIGIVTSLYTMTALYTGGVFHSVMFIGGITSLILGLLLVTSGLILNSLVQIVKKEE